jgi:eukaryotic-like serine/threonine-protein kinase
MECLGDELVFVFVRGELPEHEHAAVRDHIGACTPCRRLVSEVARSLDGATQQPTRDEGGPPEIGDKTIGRYILRERLGAGGSGVVHRAHDPQLGRDVALKVLAAGASSAQGATPGRWMREAKAMARLSDPNVVTVYDAGTWADSVFIAMELVEGRTLREWLREEARSVPAIVDALVAAGRGLAAAHAVGLVHRDFKPANVLVGHDGRVRVTDFGLAQPLRAEDVADASQHPEARWATITQTCSLGGTPAYMAPEVFGGSVGDARSDQYSFSVTVFEALYGKKPIERDSVLDLVTAVMRGEMEWPTRPAVPLAIQRALRRGLSVDPEKRFPGMAGLLEALETGRSAWLTRRRAALAGVVVAAGTALLLLSGRRGTSGELRSAFAAEGVERAVPVVTAPATADAAAAAPPAPGDAASAAPDASASTPPRAPSAPAARKHAPGGSPRAAAKPTPAASPPRPGATAADPDALLPDPWLDKP